MSKCCIPGCKETENLYRICKRGTKTYYDENDLTNKYICEKHLKKSEFFNTAEDGGYAKCLLCPDVAYNIKDLTNIGSTWYCEEHECEAPTDKELDDYTGLGDNY